MISKEFFFMCSKQVLRANVTFLAANVLSLIKRHSFNCPQEYREKKLLGNYCYLAFLQCKPSVSGWRQHSRVLFVYIGYFLASFVVPRREKKQDIYFEFRQSFKLFLLVLLFGDCLCAYPYFSTTFFLAISFIYVVRPASKQNAKLQLEGRLGSPGTVQLFDRKPMCYRKLPKNSDRTQSIG